ncbi:MAG: dihydrolipoyl dehydrogenase [bacterium]
MDQRSVDLVVLGAGPGGYAAAFYAADRGLSVLLVDKGERLGGVCLNEGCIPSKALIHATHLIDQAAEAKDFGIKFVKPKIDLDVMRVKKDAIIQQLGQGVSQLAKGRKVEVLQGKGFFEDSNTLRVETSSGQQMLSFKQAIIAVGSTPTMPAAFDLGNSRIMTSKEALDIQDIPDSLLVIGGGYIGLELGMVYASLKSRVSVVEAADTLLGGFDTELLRPLLASVKKKFDDVYFDTKILSLATKSKQIEASFIQGDKQWKASYDKVLVSVGRSPLTANLGLNHAGVDLDDRSFIRVNQFQQTSVPHIYAIGDVVGGVMLAHKASKEARIAVDAILGETPVPLADSVIPAVVFTDPEIAWCGLTEKEAKERDVDYKVGRFNWAASGKALALGRTDGLTKVIYDAKSERILGVGFVGAFASHLVSEAVLAVESGLSIDDLALTIHPHPTLSETLMEAAESALGFSTHILAKT